MTTTTTTHGPLTVHDACTLADIVRACQRTDRVRWLTDHGDIIHGVMRSVGDANGNFLNTDEDIRDGYVRISGTFEHFEPVPRVLALVQGGRMAFEARP